MAVDHGVEHHPGVVGEGGGQVDARQHAVERSAGDRQPGIEQHQVVCQSRDFAGRAAGADRASGWSSSRWSRLQVVTAFSLQVEPRARPHTHMSRMRPREQRTGDCGCMLALAVERPPREVQA